MTDEEKKMSVEEWKSVPFHSHCNVLLCSTVRLLQVFQRYDKDIDFVKKGLDKGRFEDAIKDLEELMANIVSLPCILASWPLHCLLSDLRYKALWARSGSGLLQNQS